jgi:hypothetical protein
MTMCAHHWRDRDPLCECPEEALRASIDEVLTGLAAWVTGGSYWVMPDRWSARDVRHPRHIATWQPLLEALEGGRGSTRVAARATDVLDAGLQQRAGAFGGVLALTHAEYRTYRILLELGAEHDLIVPVAVCEDCRVVFRPARKSRAAKCPRCHSSPRPATPAPRDNTSAAIARARADGWEPFRATIARESFDSNGDRSGWRSITVAWCEICKHRLDCPAHASTCSSNCRSITARRARRQREPEADVAGDGRPAQDRDPAAAEAPIAMMHTGGKPVSGSPRASSTIHAPPRSSPLHPPYEAGR